MDNNTTTNKKITRTNIVSEFKSSFLEYAMAVIIARALPDVRDGLKPVQRRIIYTLHTLGIFHNTAFKKSARIVGEVMGKYHPHGDSSIYAAMVRMAQEFASRYPLVIGHGNFGSIDGDSAAAMRYTEVKMSAIAGEMTKDINKKSVDFEFNYDDTETEPAYLPATIPNLLLNGATGIAVGMATNIPPHNLGEIISGTKLLLANPSTNIDDLLTLIKGPDFPTAAEFSAGSKMVEGYKTGKGSVRIRAKAKIDDDSILISEIPYAVNKSKLLIKIAELVKNKDITNIKDLRDESNYKGIKIVIQLTQKANANLILNKLFKMTALQTTFSFNFVALDKGQPRLLNLKQMLEMFINHRLLVIRKRTQFDVDKYTKRILIMEGLMAALKNIKEVIDIISNSRDNAAAASALMVRLDLNKMQSKAILDMRLGRLTALEKEKLEGEKKDIASNLLAWHALLESTDLQKKVIIKELDEVNKKYASPRRSVLVYDDISIDDESLIPNKNNFLIITKDDYVKRISQDSFKSQGRGGIGVSGVNKKRNNLKIITACRAHDKILFFTNLGRVFSIKAYQITSTERTAQGIPIVNLINIPNGETIASVMVWEAHIERKGYLLFSTRNGIVKKTNISEFNNIYKAGKRAILLRAGDSLLNVEWLNAGEEIILSSKKGFVIKFNEDAIRPIARSGMGVKGIKLKLGDQVISAVTVNSQNGDMVFITHLGIGKKTAVSAFGAQHRGGHGKYGIKTKSSADYLIKAGYIQNDANVLIATESGKIILINTKAIPHRGRYGQGVKLVNVKNTFVQDATIISGDQYEYD